MKMYKIEGTALFAFSREIEAEDLDDAWYMSDELNDIDIEDCDLEWPPIDITVDEIEEV